LQRADVTVGVIHDNEAQMGCVLDRLNDFRQDQAAFLIAVRTQVDTGAPGLGVFVILAGCAIAFIGGLLLGVIQNLDKLGYCGGLYSEELAVTNVTSYSENFDILDAKSFARRGANSYRSTCTPASYTMPQAPAGNTPGCSLAASRSVACTRETSVFGQAVEAALDQIMKENPEIFDFTDVQPGGAGWYFVKDQAAYSQGVVKILLSKGLCARWDGEELNVKNTNVSSENYDILTASSHVRRGEGSYRVTCYPAFF
jgi:hypothetical protein